MSVLLALAVVIWWSMDRLMAVAVEVFFDIVTIAAHSATRCLRRASACGVCLARRGRDVRLRGSHRSAGQQKFVAVFERPFSSDSLALT